MATPPTNMALDESMPKSSLQGKKKSGEKQKAAYKEAFEESGMYISTDAFPPEHEDLLSTARSIGDLSYEKFLNLKDEEYEEQFKQDIKSWIKSLLHKAKKAHCKPEDNWKWVYYGPMTERINRETTCRDCHKRIWKPLFQVPPNSGNRGTEHLEQRQRMRKRCTCDNVYEKKSDQNEIFADFSEQIIKYDDRPDWIKKTGQNWQKVDRIFGLQKSKAFDGIQELANDGDVIRNLLRSEPINPNSGMTVIYPYFMSEGKSGRASFDWNDILYKAGLTAYKCLKAQQMLRSEALQAGVSGWKSGPLLWLFTFKARDWCMYAAYLKHNPNLTGRSSPYEMHIVEICNGRIDDQKGALHLILLIDLIKDWARDDYRAAILAELGAVAASKHTDETLQHGPKRRDSDIFSVNSSQLSEGRSSQNAELPQGNMHPVVSGLDHGNVPVENPAPPNVHVDLETAANRERIRERASSSSLDGYFIRQNRQQSDGKVDNAMPRHPHERRRQQSLHDTTSRTQPTDPKVLRPVSNIQYHHPVSKSKAKPSDKDNLDENQSQPLQKRKRVE